jgi:AmiR/NasT family two-component response regulator
VVKVIIRTMSEYGIDDDEAYDLLRRRSMRTRQTMEDLCKDLARSPDGQEHGEFALKKLAD